MEYILIELGHEALVDVALRKETLDAHILGLGCAATTLINHRSRRGGKQEIVVGRQGHVDRIIGERIIETLISECVVASAVRKIMAREIVRREAAGHQNAKNQYASTLLQRDFHPV